MTKVITLVLFLLIGFSGRSQDYQWGRQFGDEETDRVIAIDVDNDGSVYVLGESTSYYFDLDPGAGSVIVDNNGVNDYGTICFLVKLDADGMYVWGKTLNVDRDFPDHAIGVHVGSDGTIYTLVQVAEKKLTSPFGPYIDAPIILYKFDGAGNTLASRKINQSGNPTLGNITASDFVVDSADNSLITGYFTGTIDLNDPNPAFDLTSPPSTAMNTFVIKLDDDLNFIWDTVIPFHTAERWRLGVQPDGDAIVLTQGSQTVSSEHLEFIHALDAASGNIVWARSIQGINGLDLAVDPIGRIFTVNILNNWSDPAPDVDPSANVHVTPNYVFMEWFTPDGLFLDEKGYSDLNMSVNFISQLYADAESNYYFLGQVDQFDVDPSPNVYVLNASAANGPAGMCLTFNNSRQFDSALMLGLTNSGSNATMMWGLEIADMVSKNANQYFAGAFKGYADLDPSATTDLYDALHISTINDDGFVIKLGPCNTAAPPAASDQYFCAGDSPTIASLQPSSSMFWYDTMSATSPLPATSPLLDGHHYFGARKNGSCPESARVEVTVHLTPQPSAPSLTATSFCATQNATLHDVSALPNLIWYTDATASTVLSPATVLETRSYFAAFVINGCSGPTKEVPVTVTDVLPPVVESQQVFCEGSNPTISDLQALGTDLKWYGVGGGAALSPSEALVNGATYFVTQTLSGCESLQASTVAVIASVPPPVADTPQVFCSAQNATLADVTATGSGIRYYADASKLTELPGNTALSNAATYFLTQTSGGCESVSSTSVSITILDTVPSRDVEIFLCDEQGDAHESIVLTDFDEEIISNPQTYTIAYYPSMETALANDVDQAYNVNTPFDLTSPTTTIVVRVSFNGLCSNVTTLTAHLVSPPVASLPATLPLCSGDPVTISAPAGYTSYEWSTGAHTRDITVTNPGEYSVTITSVVGTAICSSSYTVSVVESQPPLAVAVSTSDWTSDANSIIVQASGNGTYHYSLDGITFQDTPRFDNLPPGFYTVYVKDAGGCETLSKDVILLMYDNFFTPNADGFNDVWNVDFALLADPGLEVTIFDRYGKLIMVLHPSDTWDGTYNGAPLPSDDYWFTISTTNGSTISGHFSLVR